MSFLKDRQTCFCIYYCVSLPETFSLLLISLPGGASGSVAVTITDCSSVLLPCGVEGHSLDVTWSKDGMELLEDSVCMVTIATPIVHHCCPHWSFTCRELLVCSYSVESKHRVKVMLCTYQYDWGLRPKDII